MVDYLKQISEDMEHYKTDPIGFAINILGFPEKFIWPKMVELCEAVRDYQFVCCRAGHYVSKTFTLGRIIVPWFKTCFTPSTVVTTAPSDNQVRNQLWREIRASKVSAKIPLGGKIHTIHWDQIPKKTVLDKAVRDGVMDSFERGNWEKNFAIGFSTSPDSTAEHVTKMQGWHNEYVLVVIDEGCGMVDTIVTTAEDALINDEKCKFVITGNPTDPECEFAKMCYSSNPENQEGSAPYMSDRGYWVITIAGTDTPNYKQRKRVIPGLASYDWVNRIIKKYGEDGDGTRYRVKGLFPLFKEGTYFGRQVAAARKADRIGDVPWDPTAKVHTFSDSGDRWTATIFVQFIQGCIKIIDEYWDYEGMGIPAWANYCNGKEYTYGHEHFYGPDVDPDSGGNAKSFHTGKTLLQVAGELGFQIKPVIRHSFDDGISASRDIWPKVYIDKTHCNTLIKAMAGYGKKKNTQTSGTGDGEVVYHDHPAKTWHRHFADAWRHMAMAYRFMEIDDQYVGDVSMGNDFYAEVKRRRGLQKTSGLRKYSGLRR